MSLGCRLTEAFEPHAEVGPGYDFVDADPEAGLPWEHNNPGGRPRFTCAEAAACSAASVPRLPCRNTCGLFSAMSPRLSCCGEWSVASAARHWFPHSSVGRTAAVRTRLRRSPRGVGVRCALFYGDWASRKCAARTRISRLPVCAKAAGRSQAVARRSEYLLRRRSSSRLPPYSLRTRSPRRTFRVRRGVSRTNRPSHHDRYRVRGLASRLAHASRGGRRPECELGQGRHASFPSNVSTE